MIERQLEERRRLKELADLMREKQQEQMQALNRDVAHYMMLGGKAPIEVTHRFEEQNQQARKDAERRQEQERQKQMDRQRDRGRDHEPN